MIFTWILRIHVNISAYQILLLSFYFIWLYIVNKTLHAIWAFVPLAVNILYATYFSKEHLMLPCRHGVEGFPN